MRTSSFHVTFIKESNMGVFVECAETQTSVTTKAWRLYMADFKEDINRLESSEETEQVEMETSEDDISPETEQVDAETNEDEVTPETEERLDELEQKRSVSNNAAERHMRKRDELNKQTREWVAKRDELNALVRSYIDEAGKHREERDSLNINVQQQKELRDECNKLVSKLSEELHEMRKDRPQADKNQPSLRQLKKEFSDLERKQQTQVLKKKEEEALVKSLKALDDQIREIEKSSEQNEDMRDKSTALREAKAQAEVHHKLVSEYADKAQAEHDAMIQFYEKADAVRKEADEAQAKFIESKKAADEEHRLFIEESKSYHESDKDVYSIKSKQRAARKRKSDADNKKAANDLFARFKEGKVLDTEDLMILQKSGYL